MYVQGEYLLTADEYARALQVIRSYRRWVFLGLTGVCTIGGIAMIISGNPQPGGFMLAMALAYVFGAPLEIMWLRAKYERRTNRVPVVAVFTDATFATRSALRTVEEAWPAFVQAVETPEFFLIYVARRRAVIVPKRAFSPADTVQVSDFLRATMPTNASAPA